MLRAERARIDKQITELLQARDRLDAVIAFSEGPASDCTRMDADAPVS
ncbi:hypothetical protein AB0B10_07480 [Micromonospora arborensis]